MTSVSLSLALSSTSHLSKRIIEPSDVIKYTLGFILASGIRENIFFCSIFSLDTHLSIVVVSPASRVEKPRVSLFKLTIDLSNSYRPSGLYDKEYKAFSSAQILIFLIHAFLLNLLARKQSVLLLTLKYTYLSNGYFHPDRMARK